MLVRQNKETLQQALTWSPLELFIQTIGKITATNREAETCFTKGNYSVFFVLQVRHSQALGAKNILQFKKNQSTPYNFTSVSFFNSIDFKVLTRRPSEKSTASSWLVREANDAG